MRKLAALLVILGVLTALYPAAHRAYVTYRQQQLLTEWKQVCPPKPEPEVYLPEGDHTFPEGEGVVALLKIEKIDLELPLFIGATPANLRQGAALVEDGARPGQKGTAIITAHRSHNYGMQFNRLEELEAGDSMIIETAHTSYIYRTDRTHIVKAERLIEEIACRGEERVLILVTCHPLYSPNPPYRLVVYGKMMED